MIQKEDLAEVRHHITNCIGQKVRLETRMRHNKSTVSEGIVENTYPSIFTITLNKGGNKGRTVSCSYTDILTNAITMTIKE